MSSHPSSVEPSSTHPGEKVSRRSIVSEILEQGDGLVHLLVGILLLGLAVIILVNSTYGFFLDIVKAPPNSSYAEIGLTYLSGLLFGVIILELLSTILTYVRARNLEATIKDFLIVGLISSIRKILLIGAQSSLATKASPDEFIKESIGTVISIVGILLLIGGLLMLDRRKKQALTASQEVD